METKDAIDTTPVVNPTHGVVVEWAAIEIAALDEQVRERAGRAQLAELRPETSLEHRGVKVEHSLALDQGVRTDRVVTRRERRHLDLSAELCERGRDPALPLVDVDDDPDRRLDPSHPRIVRL